jgi:hypothetical protein
MKSPFKFLDSYTKDDREIFFGRDREIEELYHRVFESKLMLVYGVSGTGKSSLIHCGLANKFQETDWLPLIVRRGGNIINSMAGAIQASAITKQEGQLSSPIQFKKAVRSLYLDHYKPVYFIFDQFEELFIFGDKEERKSFVHIIKSLVESDLQCRLIFVMREEYMAGVTEFERYIPSFFANRVRIEKMAHVNAIEAIKGPCKEAGIDLEEGFAETLLEKLSPENSDVELTYLQVFLDKIFHRVQSEKDQNSISFTIQLLQKVGNVSDLLGSFLEEQIKELDEPDTGLTVLKSFVSVKGTKKQLTQEEAVKSSRSLGKDISAETISELLLKFVNLRILREKDENGKYELRHDSLATKIYEKITIVEKELLEIYQFLENAFTAFEKRKVLLNTNDLKYIAPYEDRLFVNKEIGDFIEKSKEELDKIRKRIKRIAIAGFCAILTFSIGTIFKTMQWPFSGLMRNAGLFVYILWFIPLFGFYLLKTKENRTINMLFLVFTMVFLVNIFLYNSIIRSTLNTFLYKPVKQTEATIKAIKEKIDHDTRNIYSMINTESNINPLTADYKEIANILKKRTEDIVNYIQDLKIQLVTTSEGVGSPSINGREINVANMKKLNDSFIPSMILIGANMNGKAFDLKALIKDHKAFLFEVVNNDSTITKGIDITLNIDDYETTRRFGTKKMERWENYTFQTLSMGFTIIRLSQMQNDIKTCESEVLTYIYDKIHEK